MRATSLSDEPDRTAVMTRRRFDMHQHQVPPDRRFSNSEVVRHAHSDDAGHPIPMSWTRTPRGPPSQPWSCPATSPLPVEPRSPRMALELVLASSVDLVRVQSAETWIPRENR